MKRFLYAVGIFAAATVLVFVTLWQGELRTLASLRQVEGNSFLYRMEFKCRYDLDELLSQDIDSNAKLLQYCVRRVGKGLPLKFSSSEVRTDTLACTSFQVQNAQAAGYLFGRNYDARKNPALLVESHPKDGYASLAMTDLSHLGYGMDKLPNTLLRQISCLAAIYAPLDGINEKGFCAAVHIAYQNGRVHQDTGRHKVGTTTLLRLWLDRCASVEEALSLLETVDVCQDATYQYLLADAEGDAAIVEFDHEHGWKTLVIRKKRCDEPLLLANHLMAPEYPSVPEEGNPRDSWGRYAGAWQYLDAHGGALTLPECLSLIHWTDYVRTDESVSDTQWSGVYDQSALTLNLRFWNDYGKTHRFRLP